MPGDAKSGDSLRLNGGKGLGRCHLPADVEHRLAVYEVGWVCEVLRMTRLAPDIIQSILDGRQPRQLSLHAMRGRQGDVPLDWEGQRRMFGFAAAGDPQ